MFENTILDRTKRAFSEQFEAQDDGYLFRERQKGAAIPVTDAERDGFVKKYGIASYLLAFVFVAGFLGIVFAVGTYTDQMASPPSDEIIVTGVIGLTLLWALLYTFAVLRAWNTPVRALSRHTAVSVERSPEDADAAMISKIGWDKLGLGAVAIAFAFFKFGRKYDLTKGFGLLLASLTAIAAAILVYQAYRKWILDRRK